jgi:hypothetical protein
LAPSDRDTTIFGFGWDIGFFSAVSPRGAGAFSSCKSGAFGKRTDSRSSPGGQAMVFRNFAHLIGALTLLAAVCEPVSAQEAWPSRPIKLVVPLTAGGGVDMMARLTAKHLSDQLGQQVVVENQGGAGGTIAANMVARSRARRLHADLPVGVLGGGQRAGLQESAIRSDQGPHPGHPRRQLPAHRRGQSGIARQGPA